MKKLYSIAAATIAGSFLLTGVAFAGGTVTNTINSQSIPEGSTCDMSGAFTFSFTPGTVLEVGERMIIDLPISTPNNVTLCKDIDFVIARGAVDLADPTAAGFPAAALYDEAAVAAAAGGPFIGEGAGATGGSATQDGIAFLFKGTSGGTRVTIDVVGRTGGSLTVGGTDNNADSMKLTFFNRVNYNGATIDGTTGGLMAPFDDGDPTTNLYGAAVGDPAASMEADENTMCINISNWHESTVHAHLDSIDTKYTYEPNSNPEIAHNAGALTTDLYTCKGVVGDVKILTAAAQASVSCNFDNEEPTTYNSPHRNPVVIRASEPFPATTYAVKLTIKVGNSANVPVAGDNGVYFGEGVIHGHLYRNTSDACSADSSALLGTVEFDTDTTAWTASGESFTGAALDFASANCEDLDANNRYVTLYAKMPSALNITNASAMVLDLPGMLYDNTIVQAGDIVDVNIELIKAPCGTFFTGDKRIVDTFVDPEVITSSTTLTYPYFTAAAPGVDMYWDGIAIVNMEMDTDLEAEVTMYESDGDIASGTVNIAKRSMYVNTLSSMVSDGTFTLATGGTGDGVLGNSRSYVVVKAPGMIDGFAMLANSATGESMGYLPRSSNYMTK